VSALGDGTRREASVNLPKSEDEHAARIERLRAEARNFDAAARLSEVEAVRIAGEVAQQPLENRKLEAEIERTEAEISAIGAAHFRADAMLVVLLLIAVLVLGLALVNPDYLRSLGGSGALSALVLALAGYSRLRG